MRPRNAQDRKGQQPTGSQRGVQGLGDPRVDRAGRRIGGQSDRQRVRIERRLAVQYTTARVLAAESSLVVAISEVLRAICEALGWSVAGMWKVDPRSNSINCVEVWHAPGMAVQEFEAASRGASMPPGVGLPGRVWASGRPSWIPDVTQDRNFPRAPFAVKVGLHSGLGFPIQHQDLAAPFPRKR